jgi:hypothetical protein
MFSFLSFPHLFALREEDAGVNQQWAEQQKKQRLGKNSRENQTSKMLCS